MQVNGSVSESRRLARSALILASASPRRAELLAAAGFEFDIRPAHVDESIRPGEGADSYARRVAEEKARVVAEQAPGRPVLGADTVVVVEGQILGKPVAEGDAKRMLRLISGRTHQVLTAVTLITLSFPPGGDLLVETGLQPRPEPWVETRIAVTDVQFATLSAEEIDWYVASGEGADKAGAYAIQGLASRFVTGIQGSYSNVVGLPVALVYEMCGRAGILLS